MVYLDPLESGCFLSSLYPVTGALAGIAAAPAAFAVSSGGGAFLGLMTAASTEHAGVTATEAKTMKLAGWDVRAPRADPAGGTSTDSVVVASSGRGAGLSYAGPAAAVARLAAHTVCTASTRLYREKVERDRDRRVG